MGWTKVCEALAPGTRQVVKVGDRKVLVLNQGGELYAVENQCPHLKLPMKSGKVDGCTITCPFHRSSFDLKTGAVLKWSTFPPVVGQALGALSAPKPIAVFPTRLEEGSVWIEVADA